MPPKLDRCLARVRAQSRGKKKKVNPYAVCVKATGIKRKKGGGWTKGKKGRR